MGDVIIDEDVTIEVARDVCKIGQGADCCRFLTMSPDGWSCEKHSDMGRHINRIVDTMTARGDNCPGRRSKP